MRSLRFVATNGLGSHAGERRGLTQGDLAKPTGIDQGDISRIERGGANPSEQTLLRIGDALGAELRLVERASA